MFSLFFVWFVFKRSLEALNLIHIVDISFPPGWVKGEGHRRVHTERKFKSLSGAGLTVLHVDTPPCAGPHLCPARGRKPPRRPSGFWLCSDHQLHKGLILWVGNTEEECVCGKKVSGAYGMSTLAKQDWPVKTQLSRKAPLPCVPSNPRLHDAPCVLLSDRCGRHKWLDFPWYTQAACFRICFSESFSSRTEWF